VSISAFLYEISPRALQLASPFRRHPRGPVSHQPSTLALTRESERRERKSLLDQGLRLSVTPHFLDQALLTGVDTLRRSVDRHDPGPFISQPSIIRPILILSKQILGPRNPAPEGQLRLPLSTGQRVYHLPSLAWR